MDFCLNLLARQYIYWKYYLWREYKFIVKKVRSLHFLYTNKRQRYEKNPCIQSHLADIYLRVALGKVHKRW